MLNKFVIAPDSFKGTISAKEVCDIIAEVIVRHIPQAEIIKVPTSDGGEGLVECLLGLLGGTQKKCVVTGPTGVPVEGVYGLLNESTAVMEMAASAGLTLMHGNLDPLHATTYGVGEMLNEIADSDAKKLILGIGGSATNDAGIGMASAIGYRFLDGENREIEPLACNLGMVEHIVSPACLPNLDITVVCDVDSKLYGPDGATYKFGKQKGVSAVMAEKLDLDIQHFAQIIQKDLKVDVHSIHGGGAAGGMGAALVAFLGAKLRPGIEMFLDAVNFDSLIQDADMVFTGEGCIDEQSVSGKVPVGVARRAFAAGVPCIALCGSVGVHAEKCYTEGITSIFSTVRQLKSTDMSKDDYVENLRFLTDSVVRSMMIFTEK